MDGKLKTPMWGWEQSRSHIGFLLRRQIVQEPVGLFSRKQAAYASLGDALGEFGWKLVALDEALIIEPVVKQTTRWL